MYNGCTGSHGHHTKFPRQERRPLNAVFGLLLPPLAPWPGNSSPCDHKRSRLGHLKHIQATGGGRHKAKLVPCMRGEDRWSPDSASLGRHSHRGRGSWPLEETPRTRTASRGRSTGRGCRLHGDQASHAERCACKQRALSLATWERLRRTYHRF